MPPGQDSYVRVIHKKGRDPDILVSYRPKSLINVDGTILSKIVARRLAAFLSDIIHPAQQGFIFYQGGQQWPTSAKYY